MSAISHADVIGAFQYTVGGIESLPAHLGNVQSQPGMRGVRPGGSGARIAGVNIAADIARGNAQQAGHADEQVGEILADPFLACEHLVRRGFQSGAAGDILVLAKQRKVDVKSVSIKSWLFRSTNDMA